MKTLTLPKRQEPATEIFRRQWADRLTPMQLQQLIDRCGSSVLDIADVHLTVTFRGGQVMDDVKAA